MNKKTDCRMFEQCEVVVATMSKQNLTIRNDVYTCLFYLYGDDCAGWLTRSFGNKPSGLSDKHNAYHAFHDACISLEVSIKAKRFSCRNNSAACRSYIYRAAKWCFLRLQGIKGPKIIDINGVENSALYPYPDFAFPVEDLQRKDKLKDMINNLTGTCRDILVLRFVETLTIEEIALKLGLERKQVIKKIFDCKKKIPPPDNFNENY